MSRSAALVRLSALGDIIHTWPLAVEIKKQRLVDRLCWVVEEPLLPLVEGHPAVDDVVTVATKRWRRRWASATVRREIKAAIAHLRDFAPDVCLDPQGVAKSALVTAATRAPRRLGLDARSRRERLPGLAYTETVAATSRARHIVARNLLLLEPLGGTTPPSPPAPDGRWMVRAGTDGPTGHAANPVIIVPGGGARSKVVAPATWARTARLLAAAGHRVVIAWGPNERDRAAEIAVDADVELAPPTGVRELASLLRSSAVTIGGDTGPVHLAASLGSSTVGVFLSTDPARNGPIGDRVRVVSCVAAEQGTGRSAEARPVRSPSADEIAAAALAVVDDPNR